MLPRSGSNVRFPDSGYISDHEPRYEPKRTLSNLPDALLGCKKYVPRLPRDYGHAC